MNMSGQKVIKGKKEAYSKCKTSYTGDRTEEYGRKLM